MSTSNYDSTKLEQCLEEDGVRAALEWLNKRVDYRFTALYIKDGDILKNIYVFDRQHPHAKPFTNSPVEEFYGLLVFAAEQSVVVVNAGRESESGKPEKGTTINAYCGLPLRRADGSIFGTLCHFDYLPREVDAAELAVLTSASEIISATLNNISAL